MNSKKLNGKQLFDKANQFRAAAVDDGWSIEPTYARESVDLHKDGFTMSILTRSINIDKDKYSAGISIWGPDKLAVSVPEYYDYNVIVANTRKCNYCDAVDVDTQRVSFAGRCCAECIDKQREKLEYNGWSD